MNRLQVSGLALSAAALVGIALHEGFRSEAYRDTVNVATIGFGSTAGVKLGDRITVERALVRLSQDVSVHEAGVRECLADVPLAPREWDAAVSLAYNIGVGAFCKSTVVKRWRAGDYAGGCDAFLMWNKAGGKVLPGLVKRREDERRTCLGDA